MAASITGTKSKAKRFEQLQADLNGIRASMINLSSGVTAAPATKRFSVEAFVRVLHDTGRLIGEADAVIGYPARIAYIRDQLDDEAMDVEGILTAVRSAAIEVNDHIAGTVEDADGWIHGRKRVGYEVSGRQFTASAIIASGLIPKLDALAAAIPDPEA